MKRMKFLLVVLSLSLAMPAIAASRLKLGTLVPVGTSYQKSLMAMAEAWRKDSGGSITLNVYAGGKLGGEAEMVGLMKLDSLQAALLTTVGLSEIERGVAGLQNIPMGFRSLDEVDYVGEKLRPMLEKRLEEKGFVVLFWTDAGWVRFFSNKQVTHPDEMKKLKMFSWSGFPAQVEIYKSAGFNAVPLETADIVPSLQTGSLHAGNQLGAHRRCLGRPEADLGEDSCRRAGEADGIRDHGREGDQGGRTPGNDRVRCGDGKARAYSDESHA